MGLKTESEPRTRWLLFALVLGQLILLSLQAGDPGGSGSRLEGMVLRLVAPVPRLVEGVATRLQSLDSNLTTRRQLISDNARLRAEVEELRRERARLFGLEEDLRRLSSALDYSEQLRGRLRAADIVYVDHSSWLQTLVLFLGDDPAERNQPVISTGGLVGRVMLAAGPYAKVQLITDRAASVGAMIERTRRQGVVRGAGQGLLQMDFVPLQADIRVGDQVVTAGIDGIYGRGIPIGVITLVEPGSELFHRVRLRPQVDFGVLDQVYLLDREPLPERLKEAQGDDDGG